MADEYGPGTYGDKIADVYDSWYGPGQFEKEPGSTVAFLKELAGEGPALELGIGTGRVAIPLRDAGVEVHGIDASEAMVAKLRAKPGGDRIPVTMGSFADFSLDARYRLIYIPFNTFWGLLTPEDERSCLACVARHLTEDGALVIEAWVPDPGRFDRGQRLNAARVETDFVMIEASRVREDVDPQRVDSVHIAIRDGEPVRLHPVQVRYVFLEELDGMATAAGLRLRERWADWNREPFGPESLKHVSVYEPDR